MMAIVETLRNGAGGRAAALAGPGSAAGIAAAGAPAFFSMSTVESAASSPEARARPQSLSVRGSTSRA